MNIGNFPRQSSVSGLGTTTDPRLVTETNTDGTVAMPVPNTDASNRSPLLHKRPSPAIVKAAVPEPEEDQGCQGFCVIL